MKLVHVQFIAHPQVNEQRTGKARGQPNQVDKEISLCTDVVPVNKKKAVFEHGCGVKSSQRQTLQQKVARLIEH
jgi:hypothetical protein